MHADGLDRTRPLLMWFLWLASYLSSTNRSDARVASLIENDWRLEIGDWKKAIGNLEFKNHPISGEIG